MKVEIEVPRKIVKKYVSIEHFRAFLEQGVRELYEISPEEWTRLNQEERG